MSLIMPILINTKRIGTLTISRTELLRDNGDHEYEYELVMDGIPDLHGVRRPERKMGTVTHPYRDGAVKLIQTVLRSLP